jgi:uncharacterized protein (TIGR02001 family)
MKTFNKTLIAASLATLGMAAAPAALANVEASATVATSYLWRGVDMGSGTGSISADAVYSTGGLSAGVWVGSGDTGSGTEYDLFASYAGNLGGLGYSVGWAEYNYPTIDDGDAAGFQGGEAEDYVYSLSYAGVTATHYDAKDSVSSYNTLSFDVLGFGVLLGDHDRQEVETNPDVFDVEMSHLDLSYGVNDSLTFTVSTIISSSFTEDERDTTVVASYSLPF